METQILVGVGRGEVTFQSMDMTRPCHQAAEQENGVGTSVNE